MSLGYYDTPLNLGDIIRQKELPGITLRDSIAKWIHVLIITRYSECRHDPSFGSRIWEHDFENITNTQKFKEELTRSIAGSIASYETRLSDVKVEIQIEQVELVLKNRRVKVRIGMKIRGIVRKTNEPFLHVENFFIGPLSYY